MSEARPNIVLLITDQQRGDALGIEGHRVIETPYLDALGREGVHFRKAYVAAPVCIAARRTLMSGQKPVTHGVLGNDDTLLHGPTLPAELCAGGYQTHLVGKLHLHPKRKRYGFESEDWADGPGDGGDRDHVSDYTRFLQQQGVVIPEASFAHGMDGNGWPARPWHLDERLHFSNWCADCALRFLERRDPSRPFFLNVSFFHPHTPCTPPAYYFDHYMNQELPEPVVGDWAKIYYQPQRGLPVNSHRIYLEPLVQKQFQAGYYGSITHIDHQIGRFLRYLPENTIVVFCSDHGEMLGDHQWSRKGLPYEASARIPLLMKFPASMGLPGNVQIDRAVELMDIMPTLLDAVGLDVPDSVDGRSVLPLVRGDRSWREYVHGEIAQVSADCDGMQYLTDGKRKYIWWSGPGQEQYFNLETDPREQYDLADDHNRQDEIAQWRRRLIHELTGRPQGFTDGRRLIAGDQRVAAAPARAQKNTGEVTV